MTKSPIEQRSPAALRDRIRAAFPDTVQSGSVTPADEETDEDLDETRALYVALRGRKWSDIPASFIKEYAYSIPLLTEESFVMFLPAWLTGALDDQETRRAMVYTFSPDRRDEDTSFMDRRVQRLSGAQKEAIRAFLSHSVDVEPSKFVKERARRALEYVSGFG